MDLRIYLNIIRKWFWLVVIISAIAGGLSYFYNNRQTKIYEATAKVYIDQTRSSTQRADYTDIITSERIARTYSSMLQDWPTLDKTAQELGFANYNSLANQYTFSVSVQPIRETQLVNVVVESNDPQMAADFANKLPEVFMVMTRERKKESFADTRQELQIELTTAEKDLEATEQKLQTLPDVLGNQNERDSLERLVERYQATYNNLSKSLADLRLAEAQTTDTISLTTPAVASSSPIRPRTLFNTILALILGALSGLALAFLIEYMDDTVKTPDEVREITTLPTLGTVVLLTGASTDERLVSRVAPKSGGSESYRVLRTNLQFSSLDKPLTTLICTSAQPGEGKSTTIINLAYVLAQTDKRVILVDADMRRPSVHRMLRMPNNVGLSTALLDKVRDPSVYLQDTELPNLRIMTTGPLPPNPAEMLGSTRMQEMLQILKRETDIILVDAPPVLAVADTSILAPQMDGTLLIVWAGKTRGGLLAQAVERLESVGVKPLGIVLNKLTQRKSGHYYGSYYYYYSNRYDNEEPKRKGRFWRFGNKSDSKRKSVSSGHSKSSA